MFTVVDASAAPAGSASACPDVRHRRAIRQSVLQHRCSRGHDLLPLRDPARARGRAGFVRASGCSRGSAGWRQRSSRRSRASVRRDDREVLQARRQQQDEADGAASHGIADAIEADIDDRFRGAPLGERHRRVEDLVPGTEQRAAEYRFPAAGDDGASSPGATSAPRPPANNARDGVAS